MYLFPSLRLQFFWFVKFQEPSLTLLPRPRGRHGVGAGHPASGIWGQAQHGVSVHLRTGGPASPMSLPKPGSRRVPSTCPQGPPCPPHSWAAPQAVGLGWALLWERSDFHRKATWPRVCKSGLLSPFCHFKDQKEKETENGFCSFFV